MGVTKEKNMAATATTLPPPAPRKATLRGIRNPNPRLMATQPDTWVHTEDYLKGKIIGIDGGANPGIRLVLDLTGETVMLPATNEQLAQARNNGTEHSITVRVFAEQNPRTHAKRHHRIEEFVHFPDFDAAAHQRALENGAKAWADITSPSAWVDELRGN
jgi:hypothetical protein